MNRKYCLVCRGDVKAGRRMAMDPLASLVHSVKRKLGISCAGAREIVVCAECMPKYEKMRARFVSKALQLSAVAVVAFIVQAYFVGVWVGLVFALFLMSFLFFYYVPGLEWVDSGLEKPACKQKR